MNERQPWDFRDAQDEAPKTEATARDGWEYRLSLMTDHSEPGG